MDRRVFVIDLDRCIGCLGCQVACKMENGVALGTSRIRVRTVGPTGRFPDLALYFLPVPCQRCEEPACIAACPTGACRRRDEDGEVAVDPTACTGCGLCAEACPYEALDLDRDRGVMDKCTLCLPRLQAGEKPACVRNCAGRALSFGDPADPESDAARALRTASPDQVRTLRDTGSHPTVRYILRHARWLDVLPPNGGSGTPA